MINVTTPLLAGKGQFETVEHTQSTLSIHEYFAHGIKGVPQENPGHKKAYYYEYNHKRTFDKLSPQQQFIINENKK